MKLKEIYPGQTEEWYRQAEANLRRYLEIVIRTYKRLNETPEGQAWLRALLEKNTRARMNLPRRGGAKKVESK